jgi:hypothetical protein
MCKYCEGPLTLSLIEIGELEKEYRYIKFENGNLCFRSVNRDGKKTDLVRKAKFCIECGRKLS